VERIYFEEINKILRIVKIFGVFTVIAKFMDFFNFVIILNSYGKPGMEYEECTLMFLVIAFIAINMQYMVYMILLKFKFPDYISKYIIEAFFSVGILVQRKIDTWKEVKSDQIKNKFKKRGASPPPS
jgi:hypothetical protein